MLPSFWDNVECPCLPSVSASIELSAPPSLSCDPTAAPPPGCTLLPPPMGQLVGGGEGRSFSSAPCQLGAGIIRNTLAISIGQDPLVVQLASLVRWVKFSNWLIWVTNVPQGSKIVSIVHIGMYMQYRDKQYAQGRIIIVHLLWAPAFTRLRQLGPNTSILSPYCKQIITSIINAKFILQADNLGYFSVHNLDGSRSLIKEMLKKFPDFQF